MLVNDINKDNIRILLSRIKPLFTNQLGKFTHKRVSDDWYYRSMAFTTYELGYVFGFNVGFFRINEPNYNYAGLNITVHHSGTHFEARQRYIDFFRVALKDWINMPEYLYTRSERGGGGNIFPRYKKIADLNDFVEIIIFLQDSIIKLNSIYPIIVSNPDNLFTNVVRAAPIWNEKIISLCRDRIKK
jgi:hypothetical protein